uniref:Reverse transcriptase n=1 Tax=Timema genevievae TaxID=629358 RepID=A0A7R9JY63_TIMGE|nr:unnamed protein product [Timema genevievae]
MVGITNYMDQLLKIKMDKFELSVISKAAAISALVTDVTLGPNSPEFDMNESGAVKSGMLLLNNSILDNSPTPNWKSLDVSHTSLGSNSSGEFDSQFMRLLTTPDVTTSGEAEIALLEEWQRCWEKLENKHLQPSRRLVHLITGKGPYPASLRKLGLIESENCECGEEGTLEHVVLECVFVLEAKRNYQREIQGILVGEVLRDPIYWKFLDQIVLEASDRAKTAYIDIPKEAQG